MKDENELEVEIILPDGEVLGPPPGFWERYIAPLGALGIIGFFLYGIAQMWAGFIGIEYHLGTGWAFTALILALVFRISLPLTIGSFFGAMDVWGWHWFFALCFAAPGTVLFFLYAASVFFLVWRMRHRYQHRWRGFQ